MHNYVKACSRDSDSVVGALSVVSGVLLAALDAVERGDKRATQASVEAMTISYWIARDLAEKARAAA